MRNRVRFVDSELMPEGQAWVMCCDDDGVSTLYLDRSVCDRMTHEEKETMLEDAWEGFLEVVDQQQFRRATVPAQR